MRTVNMLDAKTNLSKLVSDVERGVESEVIIARNGRPAARIVPISEARPTQRRLGLMAGKFPPMELEDFNALDAEVAELFGVKPE